jgi:hypothetical protein
MAAAVGHSYGAARLGIGLFFWRHSSASMMFQRNARTQLLGELRQLATAGGPPSIPADGFVFGWSDCGSSRWQE